LFIYVAFLIDPDSVRTQLKRAVRLSIQRPASLNKGTDTYKFHFQLLHKASCYAPTLSSIELI